MPQKKNPDVFELARGKSGALLGSLVGWLATLKGLPSAYDKDLQGDKLPMFAAFDTLMAVLPVIAGAVRTLATRPECMRAAIDASLMATDLADYLVRGGVPFRQAHDLAGQAVQRAEELGLRLDELHLAEYQALHPMIAPDVYSVFDPWQSIARRSEPGGTSFAVAPVGPADLARVVLVQPLDGLAQRSLEPPHLQVVVVHHQTRPLDVTPVSAVNWTLGM